MNHHVGRSLRVLITNNTLGARAGSELYVRDLALGLMRRGHAPFAYSSVLGEVADELIAATVPVLDDLAALAVPPDVIHAQHHLDAMVAMLRFPQVPAVVVCHGWRPWEERPPVFPSVRRFVAVDDLCRMRLETTPGVDPARIRTLYNAVDLSRFPRRAPLPDRPRSALVFSNYISEANDLQTIRDACREAGLDRVDVVGLAAGAPEARPELLLPQYDLVFAKARCALEAMAVGSAVIVADTTGLGGLVTPGNVEQLRRLNFGARAMQAAPLTREAIRREIEQYDARSSAEVSAFIRAEADAERLIDRLLELYGEALAEGVDWSVAAALDACSAGAAYVRTLADRFKSGAAHEQRVAAAAAVASARIAACQRESDRLRAEIGTRDDMLAARDTALDAARAELDRVLPALAAAEGALRGIQSSRTWRAFGPYRRLRGWSRSR